jgi:hypothetical protein
MVCVNIKNDAKCDCHAIGQNCQSSGARDCASIGQFSVKSEMAAFWFGFWRRFGGE